MYEFYAKLPWWQPWWESEGRVLGFEQTWQGGEEQPWNFILFNFKKKQGGEKQPWNLIEFIFKKSKEEKNNLEI